MSSNRSSDLHDKHGVPIHEGDHVYTPFRGGRHEGDVEVIAKTQADADEANLGRAPKVGFMDQNGKFVSHKPGTLEVTEKKSGGN